MVQSLPFNGTPAGGVLTNTQAASLTDVANASGQINGADSRAVSSDRTANTLEQDLTSQTGTPTQTNNAIVRSSAGRLVNLGATSSTFTIRLRDSSGGTIIASVTTASIAQNAGANWQLSNVQINAGVALRGNITSIQRTTAEEAYTCAGGSGFAVIDGSLSGTASCSACTCS